MTWFLVLTFAIACAAFIVAAAAALFMMAVANAVTGNRTTPAPARVGGGPP